MPFRHDAGSFRPNGVSRRTLNGMKAPNPRCFGVRDVIGEGPTTTKIDGTPPYIFAKSQTHPPADFFFLAFFLVRFWAFLVKESPTTP
jgi:hypothetical protein